MKGKSMNALTGIISPMLLGVVCAVIIFAVLTGKTLPLIPNPRAGLIALLIVGVAMCAGGIGQVGASGRWASPLAILGYILGVAILWIGISALSGWKLPLIQGEVQAVAAIAVIMGVKFIIGSAGYFLHLL